MASRTNLPHWGRWAVDSGRWRQSCASMERYYRPRNFHDDDMDNSCRIRYDQHIGETVEALVNTLSARNLDTLLLAAHLHFGQCWLQWQQRAA